MGRKEFQTIRCLGRQQLGDGPIRRVSIHECLRRNEATGECDVKQPRISLTPELDCYLLRLAVAQLLLSFMNAGLTLRARHCGENAPNGISGSARAWLTSCSDRPDRWQRGNLDGSSKRRTCRHLVPCTRWRSLRSPVVASRSSSSSQGESCRRHDEV